MTKKFKLRAYPALTTEIHGKLRERAFSNGPVALLFALSTFSTHATGALDTSLFIRECTIGNVSFQFEAGTTFNNAASTTTGTCRMAGTLNNTGALTKPFVQEFVAPPFFILESGILNNTGTFTSNDFFVNGAL